MSTKYIKRKKLHFYLHRPEYYYDIRVHTNSQGRTGWVTGQPAVFIHRAFRVRPKTD